LPAFCMRLGRVPLTKLIKLSPDVEGWMQSARPKCRNNDSLLCGGGRHRRRIALDDSDNSNPL
jgi:hypothetical protein